MDSDERDTDGTRASKVVTSRAGVHSERVHPEGAATAPRTLPHP